MLLTTLILVPLIGIFLIITSVNFYTGKDLNNVNEKDFSLRGFNNVNLRIKVIGLATSIFNL
ncbi:MAG: hypothetical protein EOP34_09610 [Rickettsiales bacterium]|nr:MAG: hypothetical protein EOP34_09610 [Rickettsiales bacterium]